MRTSSASPGPLRILLLTAGFFATIVVAPAEADNVMGDVVGNAGGVSQYSGECLGSNCTFDATPPGFVHWPGASCLTVQPGISLCSDGSVKVPPGMKMSVAARRFVAELKKIWPAACGVSK